MHKSFWPGDGQVIRNDSQHSHEMHRTNRHVDPDQLNLHFRQYGFQLISPFVISAETTTDNDRFVVEPHRISPFKRSVAAD